MIHIFSKASKTHIPKLIEIRHYLGVWNADNLKRSVSFSPHYEEPQGCKLSTKTNAYPQLCEQFRYDRHSAMIVNTINRLLIEYYYNPGTMLCHFIHFLFIHHNILVRYCYYYISTLQIRKLRFREIQIRGFIP